MRKIKMMLIAIAVLLPSLASVDVPAWEWGPKYMGEMHIGYGTSRKQNGYKAYCGRAMLGTLQGVQLSNYLSAAVGVDAVMFTHYYKGQDMRFNMDVYLDLRGYYMGQFRDKSSHVVLAEWRQMFNTDRSTWVKRMLDHVGYVVWGGAGFMGPTPAKIEGVLPNLGVGLRVEIQPRMNLRLDFGRDMVNRQNLFYLNMTEAF